MKRKKRSRIWTMDKSELEVIVKKSGSIAEIIRTLDYKSTTGSIFKMLKDRCALDGISVDHIPKGAGHNKGRKGQKRGMPLDGILIEHSSYTNRGCLKKRLIEADILTNECEICNMQPIWNGQSITMILDHINGVNDDHRKENLRLVCPNCNSQLPTTGSRNFKWNK